MPKNDKETALTVADDENARQQFKWTLTRDELPKCEYGAEVGPVLYCTKYSVYTGFYGTGGKWRDSYFREYHDATEGIDSEDVIAWGWAKDLNPPLTQDEDGDSIAD